MARTKQTVRRSNRPIPNPSALDPLPPHTQPFIRTGPEAVAYHIPTLPSPSPSPDLKTTIALPRYSNWSSGLHFHTTHTEYLRLLRGSIFVSLNGSHKILSASAGGEVCIGTGQLKNTGLVVEIPKYARHEWMRAEAWLGKRRAIGEQVTKLEDMDDEVVVEEWTEPRDLGKALFFWNLNGVITGPAIDSLTLLQWLVKSVFGNWWIPFQLFVIFWDLDNWPVFLRLEGIMAPYLGHKPWVSRYVEGPVEYAISLVVLFAAKVLGWLIGVRAVEKERTPDGLWEAYKRDGA